MRGFLLTAIVVFLTMAFLCAFCGPAWGQQPDRPDQWTVADVRSGAIPVAPGMTDQDAVNFANRYHPKPVQTSNVLQTAPESPEPDCSNPYSPAPCTAVSPRTWETPAEIKVGQCYRGPYSSVQLIVLASAASALRPAVPVYSAEWIPHPGSNTRGPVSFYADQLPMPLYPMVCPGL